MYSRAYLSLALLLFLLLPGWLMAQTPPLTPDLQWKGRIVVEFSESLGAIQVDGSSGIALIGHPSLDALARQFNVYKMEKLIPWAQPPEDPSTRDISRYYLVEFPIQINLHEVAQAYADDPNVITAEPYQVYKTDFSPNDPYFSSQWALTITQAAAAFDYCQGSTAVVIGIVDSGTDTTHPDLRNNLWINPGEDLNHNGMIEPSEWNGVDNDLNGYIDDFWGWNVWQNNNNVMDILPIGGHGTHCAGCADAVANNAVGVASLGYKAKILTAKAGDGEYVYASTIGISYCAANGADVISLSYGGNFYIAYEQSVISYAWSQGCAVFASAGNTGTQQLHYPAAYNDVVAVASTGQNDQLSGFSNYGTWIDVCAPGESILSTVPGGSYASWDGTSFSTPITAGLAALVWAAKPTWTNAQVVTQIENTCTNINAQNPGFIGMLGHGRISAGTAITSLFPQLSYTEQVFDDNGNNDGRPDPGEICDFLLTVANASTSMAATGVNITLTCPDPAIIINQASCSLGNIPVSGSANNHADPINFSVSSGATPHEVTFTLTLTVTNPPLTIVTPIVQMVGRPGIVVVDDDGGVTYQTWYDQDLDSLNLPHDIWNVATQGAIPTATLQLYPTVIWHTSTVDNPLTTAEQTTITTYLNGGGHIFLTGEDIDEQLAGSSFYSTTLHATSLSAAGFFQLAGVVGDPISAGTNLWLIGTGGAGNSQSPSAISPGTGASTVYTYTSTSQGAGVKWASGNNKIVYFSFNFEAISGISGTTTRMTVLNNIFNWFGVAPPPPVVQVTLTPVGLPIVLPASGGSFNFNVAVTNTTTQSQTTDGFAFLRLPSGSLYGPVLGPVLNLTLPAGGSINRDRTQNIPGNAPAGSYKYICYVGDYISPTQFTVTDADSFPFSKSGVDLDSPFQSWMTSGEPFEAEAIASPVMYGLDVSVNPNPFNPVSTISFALPQGANVWLTVYDLSGRTVATLLNGWREAGAHRITFDGSGLASGLYLYRIQAGAYQASGKMMLMK